MPILRVVQPSAELAEKKVALEKMLHGRVYRHPQVLRMRQATQAALGEMFAGYLARPELLPEKFRGQAEQFGLERSTVDYLAGMTDRFALREHARLFKRA